MKFALIVLSFSLYFLECQTMHIFLEVPKNVNVYIALDDIRPSIESLGIKKDIKALDTLGKGNILRSLDTLGRGNILITLDILQKGNIWSIKPLGIGNTLRSLDYLGKLDIPRSLDTLGKINILRLLDTLRKGNIHISANPLETSKNLRSLDSLLEKETSSDLWTILEKAIF